MKKTLKELFNIYISIIIILVFVIGIGSFFFLTKTAFETTEKRELKNAVEMILALISEKEKDVLTYKKSRAVAQLEIIDLLSHTEIFDLGKYGYPVILDEEGVLLVHPELQYQNALDFQDYSKEAIYFVRDQIEKADQGGGFTKFLWKIPETEKIDRKIVYSKRDPNWNWIVQATSFELDYGLNARNVTIYGLIVFFILSIVILVINKRFIKQVSKPLEILLNAFNINNNKFFKLNESTRIAELDVVFSGFNKMIERLERIQFRLESEHVRYKKVVRSSYDSYWEYDFDADVIKVENFKNTREFQEIDYSTFISSIHVEDLKKNDWLRHLIYSKVPGTYEADVRIHDEQYGFKWHRIISICDEPSRSNPLALFGSIKDIHEMMLEKSKTEYRAYHDLKTGLFSYDYFSNKLLLDKFELYHFAFVGLRNFEHLKLVYGHEIVELFQFQLAGLLADVFSSRGDVCTYDDHRFLVVSEDALFDEITYRHIITKMNAINFGELPFPKDLVISVSCEDLGHTKLQDVVNNLLVAYDYNDKYLSASTMNSVDLELLSAHNRKKEIEKNLLQAINLNELHLVYQPIINHQYQLLGFEALLRWENKTLGFVSPAEFIPIAESIQFVNKLGKYVIKNVCQMLSRLNELNCMTNI